MCPLTLDGIDIIEHALLAEDGFVYDREALKRWLAISLRSPMTQRPMPQTCLALLVPAVSGVGIEASVLDAIEAWMQEAPRLVHFIDQEETYALARYRARRAVFGKVPLLIYCILTAYLRRHHSGIDIHRLSCPRSYDHHKMIFWLLVAGASASALSIATNLGHLCGAKRRRFNQA